MNNQPDNPPAFPKIAFIDHPDIHGDMDVVYESDGVSLRDYFAAAALQTMRLDGWSDNPLYWEGVTKTAFAAADAMLIARQKPIASTIPDDKTLTKENLKS